MFDKRTIIGKPDKHRPFVIWGAGVSGLLLGYYLKKNGYSVTVKEIQRRGGGKVETSEFDGHVIEHGANALFLNDEAYNLVHDLNLLDDLLIPPKNLKRKIFHTNSFHTIFSQIPFFRLIRNLRHSTPAYHDALTLSDFFTPWLGTKAVANLLNPALGGIYATTCDQILFSTLFDFNESTYPRSYWQFIAQMRKKRRIGQKPPIRGSVGFRSGMKRFTESLVAYLADDIHYGVNEKPNFSDQNNFICTDAKAAMLLLEDYPEIVDCLEDIEYAPISSTTIFLNTPLRSLENSFGVVFGPKAPHKTYEALGVLANHNIFNKNYPKYYSYTLISRKIERSKTDLFDDLKLMDENVKMTDVVYSQTFNWKLGLPIYNLKRFQAIERLHKLLGNKSRIGLFGNYVAGISMREMILVAHDFVKRLNREEV